MFNIDLKSSTPIYEQIVNQVKEAILKGYLKKGDPLPSVRKLSVMLDVNPNTIAKAYRELEQNQVIVTLRGRGTFIAEETVENIDINKELLKIRPTLAELKLKGISNDQIIKFITELLNELEGKEQL